MSETSPAPEPFAARTATSPFRWTPPTSCRPAPTAAAPSSSARHCSRPRRMRSIETPSEVEDHGGWPSCAKGWTSPGSTLPIAPGMTWSRSSSREWTRIGRSLAADVRFDDPTVSRRHALIVRQPDGLRVLDDRSLNGVFVNGERVEWSTLADGDEVVIGRHHLHFIDVPVISGMRLPSRPSPAASEQIWPRAMAGGGSLAYSPRPMHATISVLSQKGGTGKTTGFARSPTCSAAPNSPSSPSTSTPRETCRTTSTSIPTPRRRSATCWPAAPRR